MDKVKRIVKGWNLKQSWWITLTFPFGFLSWAAFLYVGLRARHKPWLIWAAVYSAAFAAYAIADGVFRTSSLQFNIALWIYVVAWIASIIHAFVIRTEFQVRREAEQLQAQWRLHTLQEQLVQASGARNPMPFSASQPYDASYRNGEQMDFHPISAPMQLQTPQRAIHGYAGPAYPPAPPSFSGNSFGSKLPVNLAAPAPISPYTRIDSGNATAVNADSSSASAGILQDVTSLEMSQRQSLSVPTPSNANGAHAAERGTTSQRTSAVEHSNSVLASELDQRIRDSYPFPLAFAYRTLSAVHEPEIRYKEQLRVAENALAFVASVGLSLAASAQVLPAPGNPELTREYLAKCWQGGISPGSWLNVGRATGSLLRGRELGGLAGQFAALWFRGRGGKESEFAALARELVVLKNDFKHDRGPITPTDYANGTELLRDKLRLCFEQMAFFIQHLIRMVEDVDVDWQTHACRLDTLIYMGDHPGFKAEMISYPSAVPTKKLYMEGGDQQAWTPLYPFISVQHCPFCKARETYMVDRWEGLGKPADLKSFERGHAVHDDAAARAVGADLTYWFNTYLPLIV